MFVSYDTVAPFDIRQMTYKSHVMVVGRPPSPSWQLLRCSAVVPYLVGLSSSRIIPARYPICPRPRTIARLGWDTGVSVRILVRLPRACIRVGTQFADMAGQRLQGFCQGSDKNRVTRAWDETPSCVNDVSSMTFAISCAEPYLKNWRIWELLSRSLPGLWPGCTNIISISNCCLFFFLSF